MLFNSKDNEFDVFVFCFFFLKITCERVSVYGKKVFLVVGIRFFPL